MRAACIAALLCALAGCHSRTGSADGGATDAGDVSPDGGPLGSIDAGASVLQHHLHASRDGAYVDRALTKAAVAGLHRDAAFDGSVSGHVYAQPLYVDRGGLGDALIVATESDQVAALDAQAGGTLWARTLGTPAPLSSLDCGDVDPLGITGTPIADAASGTLYLDAMVADGGRPHHSIFALSLADGHTLAGWPIDPAALVSGFDGFVQNQRGALALVGGTLFVPYGGHAGDCDDYRGFIVGVPVANPAGAFGWHTRGLKGGIWMPGGVSSDGASIFATTGNTAGATDWADGEAVLRFAPAAPLAYADSFAPADWRDLDNSDADVATAPMLVDVPGSAPSALAVAFGKDGKAYLLDRGHLGGIGGELRAVQVSSDGILGAPAALATSAGTLLFFHGAPAAGSGCSGDLTALRLTAGAPPSLAFAWCASQNGAGGPIASTSDGANDGLVWAVGSEGDERLRAFDAQTGAVVFGGGGAGDKLGLVRRFSSPIVARGRVFVAGDGKVASFTTR